MNTNIVKNIASIIAEAVVPADRARPGQVPSSLLEGGAVFREAPPALFQLRSDQLGRFSTMRRDLPAARPVRSRDVTSPTVSMLFRPEAHPCAV